MAFQRPFLISLKRSDSSQKWGFGIKGGKDYGEPLYIQTVAEDSVAERCGLREGDEVIQVGRVNVQDLTLGQAYEVLARCGNKIEIFVIREDLLSPRKGKEPPVVKAVVHNPYNSPLSLYSTENIAETLAKQTEVLTEGHVSEEEEGPESLSFKQKSAVFQLLEEQAKQEYPLQNTRSSPQTVVRKPKAAPPPPPPKPKPPSQEHLYNGYESAPVQRQQSYQDHQKPVSRTEYQVSSQKVVNQYQYQQAEPPQYQSSAYQTSSYQKSPDYQSPAPQSPSYQAPVSQYQQPQRSHQQTYQQTNYQQSQGYSFPAVNTQPQYPGYQSPTATPYQPLNQINYQQTQNLQNRQQVYQQDQLQQQKKQSHSYQPNFHQKENYPQKKQQQNPASVSKAEFKIRPSPPPRGSSVKQDTGNMTAVYRQQYEQHLQQQYEQQQMYANNIDHDEERHKAHLIDEDIFEHNSTSGTPITYKAPPVAPPKPNWPPPPSQAEQWRNVTSSSPTGMKTVTSAWPPKKSTVTELPRAGFNPAAVREQGTGRRCVWPPPKSEEEMRSGCTTPQSPITGRRIQWNPSPSPPVSRRTISPARRKDVQWPPNSADAYNNKEIQFRNSPRLARKAQFDDYVKEHASINVPQTYRPPPGTQHVEYR